MYYAVRKKAQLAMGNDGMTPTFFLFLFYILPRFLSSCLLHSALLYYWKRRGETTTTEYYIEIDRGSNPPGRLFIHSPDVCVYTMAVYL